MNTYKVGDKVLYNGEVHTVIQVPVNGLTLEDVGYVDKNYVVLDLHYANAIHHTVIEPYKTAHDKLLELGWEKTLFSSGIDYVKFNEIIRRNMVIRIAKDSEGYFVNLMNTVIDLELSKILAQYLEELESGENE